MNITPRLRQAIDDLIQTEVQWAHREHYLRAATLEFHNWLQSEIGTQDHALCKSPIKDGPWLAETQDWDRIKERTQAYTTPIGTDNRTNIRVGKDWTHLVKAIRHEYPGFQSDDQVLRVAAQWKIYQRRRPVEGETKYAIPLEFLADVPEDDHVHEPWEVELILAILNTRQQWIRAHEP
ncbi:MAG: hypothetical protein ACPHID_06895 [Thermoplasmatota archaeon]